MPNVQMPDGQIAEFPDSMSNEDIEKVIGQHLSENQNPTQPYSGVDTAIGNLPRPTPEMFKPTEEQINQAALMAMPEGKIVAPVMKGLESVPGIGGFIQRMSERLSANHPIINALMKTGGHGAEGATLGAASNPQDRESGALRGLILGSTIGSVVEGKNAIKRGLLPNSPLSDAELKESGNLTAGTQTDLGNVINNPYLKRMYENVLPDVPFSGANEAMQNTAKVITNRGQDILDELKGDHEGNDLGKSLQEALSRAEAETRGNKVALFNKVNDAAEKEGINTDRSNLRTAAKDALDSIKSDPDLDLLADDKTKNLLTQIAKKKSVSEFPLKQTDFLRGKLGDKAHDAYMNSDTELGNIYKSLKEAADKDINDSIDSSGSEKVKSLRDTAMKYYREQYAPFEDEDILKFTRKGGDPDLLTSAFIKTSKVSDRANLLSQLTSKLPKKDQSLLAYSYLSRSIKDGGLNPQVLSNLFKSLGNRQKNALLSPDMVNRLTEYSKLVQKNSDPLNAMFNPKTGQRGSSVLAKGLQTMLAGIGGVKGGITGAIMGAAAPSVIARPATYALTDPKIRQRFIDAIINSRKQSTTQSSRVAPLVAAILEGNKNQKKEDINGTR